MTTLKGVGPRLFRTGAPGSAWSAQLAAEIARFEGVSDPQAWTEVAELWGAIGQRHEQAWALLRVGESEVAVHDKPGAASTLLEARAIADSLGASTLGSQIDDVVREARLQVGAVPRQRSARPHGLALTERELEVLALVAEGRTNDEIATELFISAKTASVHLSHIFAKLGVRRRTEAAAAAHRLNLLP
jgi:DNA-binding CsgD family transcriptional regulator